MEPVEQPALPPTSPASSELQQIPPVEAPEKRSGWRTSREQRELTSLERTEGQTLNIRRLAAYGALALSFLLFGCGALLIAWFAGVFPGHPVIDSSQWHLVVSSLAALFSVPTVLFLAVLRAAAPTPPDDSMPASLQEAFGSYITKIVDKLLDLGKK